MNIEDRKEMVAAAFVQRFGNRPTLWTRAPAALTSWAATRTITWDM